MCNILKFNADLHTQTVRYSKLNLVVLLTIFFFTYKPVKCIRHLLRLTTKFVELSSLPLTVKIMTGKCFGHLGVHLHAVVCVVKPQLRGRLESNCCEAWANLWLIGAHS